MRTTNAKFEQRGQPWTSRRCFFLVPFFVLLLFVSLFFFASSISFRWEAASTRSPPLCHTDTFRRRYFVRVILHFCTVCVYLNVLSFYAASDGPTNILSYTPVPRNIDICIYYHIRVVVRGPSWRGP